MPSAAWALKIVKAAEDRILEFVAPYFEITEDPSLMPRDVLGCGHYGCVFSTDNPNVVIKLTSDGSEALFVASTFVINDEFEVRPGGLVDYLGVAKIKGASFRDREVYLIIREAAKCVGLDQIEECCPNRIPDTDWLPWDEQLEEARKYGSMAGQALLDKFMKIGHTKAFSAWASEQRFICYEMLGRGGRKMIREMLPDYDADMGLEGFWGILTDRKHDLYCAIALYCYIKSLRDMRAGSGTRFWDNLIDVVEKYLWCGVLLSDIHGGNIGLSTGWERRFEKDNYIRDRVVSAPIVTDPGHATFLDSSLVRKSVGAMFTI
jgi:hypothetical protein